MGLFKFFQKTEEPKTAPQQNEVAWGESAFMNNGGGFEQYNPDMLASKKGAGIYKKMLLDSQVSAVYNLIVNIIISRQGIFEKRNDDPIQDEIIDFFNHQIKISLKGTWIKALKTIMLGKAQGFSVSEKVWDTEEIDGKPYWVVRNIKTKPYDTFQFVVDDYDNVKSLMQDQNGLTKKLNPDKFIIFVNNPDIDPVWGSSDLKAAYRPYWIKDTVSKFEAIWMERMAGGFVLANTKDNAPNLDATQRAAFQNVLSRIQKSTSIWAPKGVELDVVNAQDTQAFDRCIVRQNREIAKALLVPNLLGFSEEGSFGSRALGEVQKEAFLNIVKEQGDYLADVANEQLFSQLSILNFGEPNHPLYKFEDFTIADRRAIADAWTNAVEKGTVLNTFEDELRTRELLAYEPREEEAESVTIKSGDNQEPVENSERVIKFKEEKNYINRVDFKEVGRTFDNNEAKFSKELSVVVDKIFAEIDAVNQKIITNLPADRAKIKYDKIAEEIQSSISAKLMSELKTVIKDNLNINYDDGRSQAQKTIKNIVSDLPGDVRQRINLSCATSQKLACKADDWSVRHFIDGITLQTIQNWVKQKSFKITGDITSSMLASAEQVVIDGITNEQSYREITDNLREVLGGFLGTPNADGVVTDKANRERLENIARTNITNIFNQAQLAVYAAPELGDFVDGLEYSAVLDSRTTEFCRSYDTRKFRRNDPIWGTITPPNHFKCRSIMSPITIFDQWAPSKPLSIEPSPGFR